MRKNLESSTHAKMYLAERGLTNDTIKNLILALLLEVIMVGEIYL